MKAFLACVWRDEAPASLFKTWDLSADEAQARVACEHGGCRIVVWPALGIPETKRYYGHVEVDGDRLAHVEVWANSWEEAIAAVQAQHGEGVRVSLTDWWTENRARSAMTAA
jgi:hypothetical protein